MVRFFTLALANIRYIFIFAVAALAALAVGSLGRGVLEVLKLAAGGAFVMDPGSGAQVVPYFIRAAFLYFLASALCSLFVAEPPAPQWMQVRNLFQLRVKVLAFVAVILPLAFMGRVMAADLAGPMVLYSGAGVFLVLMGIFFLVRFGPVSGDESMAREGTRVPDDRVKQDRRPKPRREQSGKGGKGREKGPEKSEEWLEKQKENLKFQKESLGQVTEREGLDEDTRQGSNVTVRPGPRRPRRRR